MTSPTAVIADDEPLLRAQLKDTLAVLWPELKVLGEAAHGEAAVRLIGDLRPALAFLDIEMPGLNGLEVAAQVKGLAHVVFITAYDQYAVAAFERGAVDYVVKPSTEQRLAETVARLKGRLAQPLPTEAAVQAALAQLATALGRTTPPRLRWIQASMGTALRLVPVDDVLYFDADAKYTRVVTRDAESLIRKPLRELADELDPADFCQVHRSTIVNLRAIAHLVREDDRLTIVLKDRAERIEVSRSYAHLFKSM